MYWAKGKQGEKKRKKYINLRYVLVVLFFKIFKIGKTWQFIYFLKRKISLVYCLQFYVRLGPKSPLDERQIVHQYWQHATNLAKVTVFVVYMSSTRVLVWVWGRAKQKRFLTFCVFRQTKNKCYSSSTFPKFPKLQLRQNLFTYGTPFHTPNTTSSYALPH